MNTTKSKIGTTLLRIVAAIVAVVLVVFTFSQIRLAAEPTVLLVGGELSFKEYTEELSQVLTEQVLGKHAFVNLNGLYCRITGRNTCNQVMRLNNGMLTNLSPERFDMTASAQAIAELSDFCAAQGIQLIYALAPEKLDANSELLITGEENHSNENADELLSRLAAAGVATIDLREYLAQTPQQIEQYFYRTDHHWNHAGAFVAYQKLMETLDEEYPDSGIDLSRADISNWEAHTLTQCFLGSHGRRTGIYFGGMDDITYYTPNFETDSSCDVLLDTGETEHYSGDFEKANMRQEYIHAETAEFGTAAYNMYMGGDNPLVRHRSTTAPSDLRVVMIKDSFALPVEAFMSTQFNYLDVVDPRYGDINAAAQIVEAQPDVVIVLVSANSAASYPAYSDLGVSVVKAE